VIFVIDLFSHGVIVLSHQNGKRFAYCPQSHKDHLMSNQSEPLSRRDQLAAAVMQGIITANAGKRVGSYEIAETAVKHADALITALAKIQA